MGIREKYVTKAFFIAVALLLQPVLTFVQAEDPSRRDTLLTLELGKLVELDLSLATGTRAVCNIPISGISRIEAVRGAGSTVFSGEYPMEERGNRAQMPYAF